MDRLVKLCPDTPEWNEVVEQIRNADTNGIVRVLVLLAQIERRMVRVARALDPIAETSRRYVASRKDPGT